MLMEMLGPSSEEMVIVIVSIIGGVLIVTSIVAGIVATARIIVRHRERLALIGMGIDPDSPPEDIRSRMSNFNSTTAGNPPPRP